MFDEVERVRERRRERMQKILLQNRDAMPPYQDELHDPLQDPFTRSRYFSREHNEETPPHFPSQDILKIQTFVSILLVGVAYIMFQTSVGVPAAWREEVKLVLTRDFNFEGVAQWYEQKLGTSPTVLPVLTTKKGQIAPASTTVQQWTLPSYWKVARPFDDKHTRVVLESAETGDVTNSELGWVTSIGEKEGFGQTVVIRYAGGREAWYGNLGEVRVAVNDFVKPGELIGVGKSNQSNQSNRQVIIAIKEQDKFIDPMDVITLE